MRASRVAVDSPHCTWEVARSPLARTFPNARAAYLIIARLHRIDRRNCIRVFFGVTQRPQNASAARDFQKAALACLTEKQCVVRLGGKKK